MSQLDALDRSPRVILAGQPFRRPTLDDSLSWLRNEQVEHENVNVRLAGRVAWNRESRHKVIRASRLERRWRESTRLADCVSNSSQHIVKAGVLRKHQRDAGAVTPRQSATKLFDHETQG